MSSGNKNVISKNYIHRTLVVWTNVINNFRLLGINVIERNCPDYKYVEIFTNRVGSIILIIVTVMSGSNHETQHLYLNAWSIQIMNEIELNEILFMNQKLQTW
jgi:hypothetical protein